MEPIQTSKTAPASLAITTTTYTPAHHSHLLPTLAAAHAATITNDHTLLRFLPPFAHSKLDAMLAWWEARLFRANVGEGEEERVVVLEVTRPRGDEEDGYWRLPRIVGAACLELDPAETGPFRAGVEMVLVDPGFRRRGVAGRLMARLEEEAGRRGRSLLVSRAVWPQFPSGSSQGGKAGEGVLGCGKLMASDAQMLSTEKGSYAETFFTKMGYTAVSLPLAWGSEQGKTEN